MSLNEIVTRPKFIRTSNGFINANNITSINKNSENNDYTMKYRDVDDYCAKECYKMVNVSEEQLMRLDIQA